MMDKLLTEHDVLGHLSENQVIRGGGYERDVC